MATFQDNWNMHGTFLAFLSAFSTIVGLAVSAQGQEDQIHFAYMGRTFMMDRTGYEETVIERFTRLFLSAADMNRGTVRIRNLPGEEDLYLLMAQGRILVAAVTPAFFKTHESQLALAPLAVPLIDGRAFIRYSLVTGRDQRVLNAPQDLWAKTLSVPDYEDEWLRPVLKSLDLPDVISAKRHPTHTSILQAVIDKSVDAGLTMDSHLRRFFSENPGSEDAIKVIAETAPVLIPPLVYQEGRLREDEFRRAVKVLLNAPSHDPLQSVLITMGFSGFRKITPEEIRRAAP